MIQLFHYINLLSDVFFQVGFTSHHRFIHHFDCIQSAVIYCITKYILLDATKTYPKAPLPIDLKAWNPAY